MIRQPLNPDEVRSLMSIGRRMPKDRHQEGWVEEVGKRRRKWRGHYYVYEIQPDGTEKRRHKAPTLGLKSEMKKYEAEKSSAASSLKRRLRAR